MLVFYDNASSTCSRVPVSRLRTPKAMAELEELKKNPLAALEIAVGDPFAQLKAQDPKDGYSMDQLYRSEDTRFILKKARFSRDDIRVFDVDGELALVSHHPGKNPMDTIDPFGVTNTDVIFSPLGEWEALTDVSSYRDDLSSLKIRPKTLTSTLS